MSTITQQAKVWSGVVSMLALGACAQIAGIDTTTEEPEGGGGTGGQTDVGSSSSGSSTGGGTGGQTDVSSSSSGGGSTGGGKSCNGLAATCGPSSDENCCASPVVTGGEYDRSNDEMYPATVSDFRLDRFEITVGRFRKFVEAYPDSKPKSGDGVHPSLIPGSGWNSDWNTNLPANQAALKTAVKCDPMYQTWTDTAGNNEQLPMNCLNWYTAFAFCAWDGGRLPTEAEWNYAAAGGIEQRVYPWGDTAPDATYAVYDCLGDGSAGGMCAFADILKAGSKSPKGDGKWGQADLGGSMWEWNLDWSQVPYAKINCMNCAGDQGTDRVRRGGGWSFDKMYTASSYREKAEPGGVGNHGYGARCARTP